MTKSEWVFGFIVVLIIGVFVVAVFDVLTALRVPAGKGVVVDKAYSAATHGTGVGVGSSGRSSGPVVVNTWTPEEWVVIVRHNGQIFSVETTADIWASVDKGSEVEVIEIRGNFGVVGKRIAL